MREFNAGKVTLKQNRKTRRIRFLGTIVQPLTSSLLTPPYSDLTPPRLTISLPNTPSSAQAAQPATAHTAQQGVAAPPSKSERRAKARPTAPRSPHFVRLHVVLATTRRLREVARPTSLILPLPRVSPRTHIQGISAAALRSAAKDLLPQFREIAVLRGLEVVVDVGVLVCASVRQGDFPSDSVRVGVAPDYVSNAKRRRRERRKMKNTYRCSVSTRSAVVLAIR